MLLLKQSKLLYSIHVNTLKNKYNKIKAQTEKSMSKIFIASIIFFLLSAVINESTAQTGADDRTGFYAPTDSSFGSSKPVDIAIKMDDGVELKGMVYYPTVGNGEITDQKFPVIIEMTPYPERNGPAPHIAYFNKHGYIFMIIRPRGTGGSEGEVQQFNSRDGLDGKTVAYWAGKQLKGSNGSVGLFGCSYPGATALATAAVTDKSSPIKAVISACIGLDVQFRQVWSTNGLPNGALAAYAPNANFIMGNYPSTNSYWSGFYDSLIAGGKEAYDGYWQDRLPLRWAKNIVENNIPVLLWGGWKDINETGAVQAYAAFQNAVNNIPVYKPMPKNIPVSAKYQLIMGDWGHGQGLEPLIFVQWYDTWIKGLKTGMEATKNPLHIYEIGSERWINTDRYPLVSEYSVYYLNPNQNLSTAKSSIAGTETIKWTRPSQKNGKVTFSTSYFKDGITLAGPMSVTLYASSSNTNLELIASLYDVSQTGDSIRINFGAVLGSQSELDMSRTWKDKKGTYIWPWPKLDKDIYLIPNKVNRFDISLATRQYAVKPGHKLVLQITSQSPETVCPDKGPVPFTAEPCGLTKPQSETLPGGVYTIYFSRKYPSALNLPLLPYTHFKSVNKSLPSPQQSVTDQRTYTLPVSWR